MRIGIFDPYLDTMGGGEKYMLSVALCFAKQNSVDIFWDPKNALDIQQKAKDRFGFDLTNIQFTNNIFSPRVHFLERIKKALNYNAIVYLSDGSLPFVITKNLIIHFQFPVEWVQGHSILTRLKLLHVKAIICNSYFTKHHIDRKFSVKSLVVYPPVMLVESKKENKENIILHVGRFGMDLEGANYKKQDIMIAAFKEMEKNHPTGWKFVLIISVRDKDKKMIVLLKQLADGAPIEIMENPDNETLWQLYKKAKIYWHASGFGEDIKKHPERAEHFGIATAEAMGAGAVPIVINLGGQPEIVQDGKNGFLWDTKEELIEKTSMVIKDLALWKKLSNQAIIDAKKFNKERFCKEIQTLVRKNNTDENI